MQKVSHATHLTNQKNDNLNLHWDLFHDRFLTDEQLESVWEASCPIQFGGQPTRVLCSADQLLHTCEHGARYDYAPPFRWLADACQIVRKLGADLDWARCMRLAQQHRMLLPVRQTLQYLSKELDLNLPAGARLLDKQRVSLSSRLTQNLLARRQPGVHPFVRSLPRNVLAYWGMRGTRPGIGLGEFLCLVNDLDMSPSASIRHFARLTVAVTWARWRHSVKTALDRISARPRSIISMASAGPEQFEGGYAAEIYKGQVFRWTIRVLLEPADYAVVIDLLPARDWPPGSLTIIFNRSTVVCDGADKSAIRFGLSKAMFVDHCEQRLVLRCQPWSAATGDPRHLGLPIINVQFAKVLAAPHDSAQTAQSV
jgi:hypothetical protein